MLLILLVNSAHAQPPFGCPIVAGAGSWSMTNDQIQPGAYTPVTLSADILLECEGVNGCASGLGWDACTSSNPCYAYMVQCGYPSSSLSSLPATYSCTQTSGVPLVGYSTCSTSEGSDGYTGAGYGPGNWNLCFYYVVDPYPAIAPGWYSNGECDQTLTLGNQQTLTVSPTVQPNFYVGTSGSDGFYYLPDVQPDTVVVQTTGGVDTQSFFIGDDVSFQMVGSGEYPTYLELSYPGTGAYCAWAGVPGSDLTTTGYGDLQMCTDAPTLQSLPCALPPSSGPGDAVATISTTNLPANVYTICGFEGYLPGSSSNPWPVFFTTNTFSVSCPVIGPCNSGAIIPPGNAFTTTPVQSELCSIYFTINTILAILALAIVLIGAALYAGGNIMPGQSRGIIQGYAFGLIFAGVISLIIIGVSVYALSLASSTSVTQVLSLNGCLGPTTSSSVTSSSTTSSSTTTSSTTTSAPQCSCSTLYATTKGGYCGSEYIEKFCANGDAAGKGACSQSSFSDCKGCAPNPDC